MYSPKESDKQFFGSQSIITEVYSPFEYQFSYPLLFHLLDFVHSFIPIE